MGSRVRGRLMGQRKGKRGSSFAGRCEGLLGPFSSTPKREKRREAWCGNEETKENEGEREASRHKKSSKTGI
jgi:hypothetical protein